MTTMEHGKFDEIPLRQHVGSLIRSYRLAKNLSQAELAQMIGYESFQAIALIEKGERGIKLDTLEKLAGALGVRMEDLLQKPHTGSVSLEEVAVRLRATNVDHQTEKALMDFAQIVKKKFSTKNQ